MKAKDAQASRTTQTYLSNQPQVVGPAHDDDVTGGSHATAQPPAPQLSKYQLAKMLK